MIALEGGMPIPDSRLPIVKPSACLHGILVAVTMAIADFGSAQSATLPPPQSHGNLGKPTLGGVASAVMHLTI